MIEFKYSGEELWNRMERAVERVNERLRKTVQILEESHVPYAIVGGHAVRAWVAQVDEAAVRTTRDVDVLIRPADLPLLMGAMTRAGFFHREISGSHMFLEDPNGSARDAIHIVMTGELVRPGDPDLNPDIEPSTTANNFRTITLEALVRMKLNSFRDKDRVHVRDMISVGLLDDTWLQRYPEPIRGRLRELLEDPNG
ncbi:MAG: hypothetical protein ABL921_29215 [Pirellula sp.]